MSKGAMKYYFILLGIGIGFIFSGIYIVLNPQVELIFKEYSDEEILEKAAQIQINMAIENQNSNDNEDNQSSTNEEENNNNAEDTQDVSDSDIGQDTNDYIDEQSDNQENTDNQEEQDKENEDITDNNDVSDDESIDNTENEDDYIYVKIDKGDRSEEIARKFYEKGAVDDLAEFNKYIEKNKAERILDHGIFKVKAGSDYKTILDMLTVNN